MSGSGHTCLQQYKHKNLVSPSKNAVEKKKEKKIKKYATTIPKLLRHSTLQRNKDNLIICKIQ